MTVSRTTTEEGWRLYRAGDHATALATFDLALTRDRDDDSAHIGRGRCHRLLGHHDDAIADFSAAHVLRPDSARPLFERGAVSILEGRYDEALADYNDAAALEPTYPGAASYFAELYLYTGRPRAALVISKCASDDEPTNLMHRINVAHAHLLLGETGQARELYAAVADQLDPGKQLTGATIALDDFQLMRSAGIEAPGLTSIERELRRSVTTT
jgi:tetratricopeptide (TPR) repeat protein